MALLPCSSLTARTQRTRLMYVLFGSALGIFIGSLITWSILTLDCSDCSRPIKRHIPAELRIIDAKDYMTPNKSFTTHSNNNNNKSSLLSTSSLSIEESLLVLLLPSEDSTLEKLSASAHTWGKTVPKLMIFVDKDYPLLSVPSNVQVNRMFKIAHVNSHPSTTELLQILEYLYRPEFKKWKWLFFAPENIYINSFVGSEFLSLNTQSSSDVVYVGSEPQETTNALSYCAKEGGVLVNRATIEKMVENLSVCRKWSSLYSWDKGLGKCISEVSSAQCTLKLSKYFLKEEQEISLTSLLYRDSTYNHAFSIYPVTTPSRMYSLHYFYTSHEYLRLSERVESLSKMMTESCLELPESLVENSEEIQLGCDFVRPDTHSLKDEEKSLLKHRPTMRFRPRNHFQYRTWSYFDSSRVYTDVTLEPHFSVGLYKYFSREYKRATDQATREVNKKHHGRRLKLRSIVNGYVRNDPLFGNEYIIDAIYAENKRTKDTVQERIRLLQPLHDGYTVKPTKSDTTDAVNIIVPISGVTQRCYEYIDMFANLSTKDNHLRLVLVVFGEKEVNDIRNKVSSVLNTNDPPSITIVKGSGNFSRARALDQGMRTLQGGDLAFLCDVDMIVELPFFNRCRRNTSKGKMVYYPEVFKRYNPSFAPPVKQKKKQIARGKGHWASYAFGMLCIYKSDYSKVGGLDTKMMGWGGEDVNFFERVLKGRLEILRAPDLGLVHRWHLRVCSNDTMTEHNYKQCLSSRSEALGDRRQLAHFLYLLQESSPELKQKLEILN